MEASRMMLQTVNKLKNCVCCSTHTTINPQRKHTNPWSSRGFGAGGLNLDQQNEAEEMNLNTTSTSAFHRPTSPQTSGDVCVSVVPHDPWGFQISALNILSVMKDSLRHIWECLVGHVANKHKTLFSWLTRLPVMSGGEVLDRRIHVVLSDNRWDPFISPRLTLLLGSAHTQTAWRVHTQALSNKQASRYMWGKKKKTVPDGTVGSGQWGWGGWGPSVGLREIIHACRHYPLAQVRSSEEEVEACYHDPCCICHI